VIDQRVEFMEWVPQKITDVEPDVFVFKPRGNKLWVWVLRAVWKFLADTGAVKPNYITTTTYTRRVLEPMKFMEQIFKQRTELRRMFYKDGQRLLIGAEDYRDLMNDKEVSMTYFQFSTQFHVGQPGGKYNICGLIVEVVPWMRGMIVMPEENSAVKVNSRH